jgi:hypothetical protein
LAQLRRWRFRPSPLSRARASPYAPCRTFQFALSQTSPGGEIKALDPAPYGVVVITKSISITGVEGAGIFRIFGAADAITINAGFWRPLAA